MSDSLLDQLKRAGLATDHQVRQAKSERRRKTKRDRHRKGAGPEDEAQRLHRRQEEKAERDRALNRQRLAQAQEKAVASQVRQLVASHRVSPDGGEIPYRFVVAGKVKTLHVTRPIRDGLAGGRLAIVGLDEAYEVVPGEVAERVLVRDPDALVVRNLPRGSRTDEDEYPGHEVPDDLTW